MKMNDLMKQAQQMQKRMLEIREELANQTIEVKCRRWDGHSRCQWTTRTCLSSHYP